MERRAAESLDDTKRARTGLVAVPRARFGMRTDMFMIMNEERVKGEGRVNERGQNKAENLWL